MSKIIHESKNHQHKWIHDSHCDECYYNGSEDYYHDRCLICGEIA
jgi:hypothetical protein